MASIVTGGGITNIVGSHAGNTYARNKGGLYMKKKTHGTNPRSSNQMHTRTQFGRLSKHYTYTLSDADRAAWRVFASTNPVVNRLGNTTFLTAQQFFGKLSANILSIGGGYPNTPPASTAVGSPTALVINAISGVGPLQVQNTVVAAGAFDQIIMWMSPPMNPGRAFISSQLRRVGTGYTVNMNNTVTTDYEDVFGILPTAGGQRIFVRIAVINTVTGITSAFLQDSAIWT